jgi:hypothetical protein
MRKRTASTSFLFLLLIVLASAAAALSCATRQPMTDSPVVEFEPGLLRYRGPDFEIYVATNTTQFFVGKSDWVMIDAAISGRLATTARLHREAITLITPDGKRYPLARQRELSENYLDIEAIARRARVARVPLEYYRKDRMLCQIPFVIRPGSGTVADSLFISNRQYCLGGFYFHLVDTVQPGSYILVVSTPEGTGRIPFTLAEPK